MTNSCGLWKIPLCLGIKLLAWCMVTLIWTSNSLHNDYRAMHTLLFSIVVTTSLMKTSKESVAFASVPEPSDKFSEWVSSSIACFSFSASPSKAACGKCWSSDQYLYLSSCNMTSTNTSRSSIIEVMCQFKDIPRTESTTGLLCKWAFSVWQSNPQLSTNCIFELVFSYYWNTRLCED